METRAVVCGCLYVCNALVCIEYESYVIVYCSFMEICVFDFNIVNFLTLKIFLTSKKLSSFKQFQHVSVQ